MNLQQLIEKASAKGLAVDPIFTENTLARAGEIPVVPQEINLANSVYLNNMRPEWIGHFAVPGRYGLIGQILFGLPTVDTARSAVVLPVWCVIDHTTGETADTESGRILGDRHYTILGQVH